MLFLLVVILIITLFVYVKLKYFTLYGPIPGKSPQFLVGNILQTGLHRGRYAGDIFKQFQGDYGDTFHIWLGHLHMIVVCHPDDVQHVFSRRNIYEQGDLHVTQHRIVFKDALICNIGAQYKRHAGIILPLFSRGKIVNNLDLISDCTDKLLDQWRMRLKDDPNHIHLNIVDQCQNLSLAIFGYIAFDRDLQTLEESNINQQNKLTKALSDFLVIFVETTRFPNVISELYLKLNSRYRNARATIEECLNQIIEQEQSKTPEEIAERKRTSLIASMVGSLQKDEAAEAVKAESEKKGKCKVLHSLTNISFEGLSRNEVIHELLLFLVAGSETSGTALEWFIHFVSKTPRVQAKLKAELGDNKEKCLTVNEIESLTYLDCVIREVFRCFPPVVGTTRTLTVDDRLPASGAQLYKGDEIFIPFYSLARDKRCWNIDPDLFYPERFQEEDTHHHAYASIPFGGGHRQCIGQDLAWFELKVIIVKMMQQVTFGDGGAEVNAGGSIQKLTNVPRHLGVTIKFD